MRHLNYESPEVQAILNNPNYDTDDRYNILEDMEDDLEMKERLANDPGVITPRQQLFVNAMALCDNQSAAYVYAYPGVTERSACTAGSRLMQRPSISAAVEKIKAINREEEEQERRTILFKKMSKLKDKRMRLNDIISGKYVSKVTIIDQDTGATKVRFREDAMAIIQALKLDLKFEEMEEALEAQIPHGYTYESLDPRYVPPCPGSTIIDEDEEEDRYIDYMDINYRKHNNGATSDDDGLTPAEIEALLKFAEPSTPQQPQPQPQQPQPAKRSRLEHPDTSRTDTSGKQKTPKTVNNVNKPNKRE